MVMASIHLFNFPSNPCFSTEKLPLHKPFNTKSTSVSWSLSSLSNVHSQFFPIKRSQLSYLVSRIYSTVKDPVLDLSIGTSKHQLEEFSDTRLLISNVPWTCTAEDIRSLFEKFGTVLDVEFSMYNKTRNRGLAFVTMGSSEVAAAALTNLDLSEFEGRTIRINFAKLKKKKPPPPGPRPVPSFNLFVANLSYEVRTHHLSELFKADGRNVLSAEVIFNENPTRPAGYGFVSFKTKKEAEEALTTFSGKMLMGRPIRVQRSKQFVKARENEDSKSNDIVNEVSYSIEQTDTTGTS